MFRPPVSSYDPLRNISSLLCFINFGKYHRRLRQQKSVMYSQSKQCESFGLFHPYRRFIKSLVDKTLPSRERIFCRFMQHHNAVVRELCTKIIFLLRPHIRLRVCVKNFKYFYGVIVKIREGRMLFTLVNELCLWFRQR